MGGRQFDGESKGSIMRCLSAVCCRSLDSEVGRRTVGEEMQILRLTTPKLKAPGAPFAQDDSSEYGFRMTAMSLLRTSDSEH